MRFFADHEVRLDPGDWQFEAFGDLTGYLSWHVAPDRRREDEARIVGEVGAWIGSEVLGPVAGALARKRPGHGAGGGARGGGSAAVPAAGARARGRQAAVRAGRHARDASRMGGRRLFSRLGSGCGCSGCSACRRAGRSLNLRRERHALVRLIQGIAATGKAADVRVLQYGVTRDRLRDVLEEAEGWDVIHISGHGTPGELLLETAAGEPGPGDRGGTGGPARPGAGARQAGHGRRRAGRRR